MGKGLNSRIKVQKYHIFNEKNDVTLNITKGKYTINFQVIPVMVQNKTQIISNTQRNKKIVKKIHESQIRHRSLYIKKCHVYHFRYKNEIIKKIEHQIRRSRCGELFYHYYTTAVST